MEDEIRGHSGEVWCHTASAEMGAVKVCPGFACVPLLRLLDLRFNTNRLRSHGHPTWALHAAHNMMTCFYRQMETLGLCLKVLKHALQRWLSLVNVLGLVICLRHPLKKPYVSSGDVFPQ